jgi:hypothetical protein
MNFLICVSVKIDFLLVSKLFLHLFYPFHTNIIKFPGIGGNAALCLVTLLVNGETARAVPVGPESATCDG